VCDQASPEEMRDINDAIEHGVTPTDLAKDEGCRWSAPELQRHILCVIGAPEPSADDGDALEQLHGYLREAVNAAYTMYMAVPTQSHAFALGNLSGQLLDCIKIQNNTKDPEDLASDIIERIMNPLVRELLKAIVNRTDRYRDNVARVLNLSDPTSLGNINEETKNVIRLISTDFKLLMDEIPANIMESLKPSRQRKKKQRRAAP
jgi:hypothetical protein